MTRFAKFAWLTLGYTVLVILWGAFVRATGSGAGCGSHWPTCNGEIIPRTGSLDTLIEFAHRLSSGLAFLLVLALLIWAFRAYPRKHIVRLGALLSFVFMVVETLIGAGLVLFERVATDVSYARAVWMAGHLLNTFILLMWITLTAWWASGGARFPVRQQGWTGLAVLGALVLMAVIGMSGAVTALGDTLLHLNVIHTNPIVGETLLALRVYHPTLAVGIALYMIVVLTRLMLDRPSPAAYRLGIGFNLLYVAQLGIGLVNVWLKAPVWMQLVHLLVSDLLWIMLVLFSAVVLAARPQERVAPAQV
ncbi:MAG: COX15/CtaA family protein [Armatimonadota bacterium]|nr:COX15/CtaA family protein [Armatimonadota bacterium]